MKKFLLATTIALAAPSMAQASDLLNLECGLIQVFPARQ